MSDAAPHYSSLFRRNEGHLELLLQLLDLEVGLHHLPFHFLVFKCFLVCQSSRLKWIEARCILLRVVTRFLLRQELINQLDLRENRRLDRLRQLLLLPSWLVLVHLVALWLCA